MKRLGVVTFCILLTGLALAVPVLAGSGRADSECLVPENIDSGESADPASDLAPGGVVEDWAAAELVGLGFVKARVEGGFHGVWGTDNAEAALPLGSLCGVYGSIEIADGTTVGFFRGVWVTENGRPSGYLAGRFSDGHFKGLWRSLTGHSGGPLGGTYSPADSSDTAAAKFSGTWATRNGANTGYLAGTFASLVAVEREGVFSGCWANNTDLLRPEACVTGRLGGFYVRMDLADGSSLRYFRGTWRSVNGDLHGSLAGIVVDGKFCGMWKGHGLGRGYLGGMCCGGEFKGIWGHASQLPSGRLYGRYGHAVPQAQTEQLSVCLAAVP